MSMPFGKHRGTLLVTAALLATSACGGNSAVPSSVSGASNPALQLAQSGANMVAPADTTSILKLLKKDVVIGSTVDPKNGDTGPRAISIVPTKFVLQKGQLLVCNFDDKSGTVGAGTTIEVLDPKAGSKPAQFVASSKIEGCDGDAITSGNQVYATGLTSKLMTFIDQSGKVKKTYGSPIETPLADGEAESPGLYPDQFIFTGDAETGSIVSLIRSPSGAPRILEVVTGFAVNKKSGWSTLGPSGLSYIGGKRDTLYIVDGANNTIVAISHASTLFVKDEIVVQPGGKTFKCKFPKTTCGTLLYGGAPLNGPVASTLLPNGNLIVANTVGGNKLVEISAAGKLLATKTIDFSTIPHVFGLRAVGTGDKNTTLYFTDTKDNSLHELQQ
jgi:hypothetical protein